MLEDKIRSIFIVFCLIACSTPVFSQGDKTLLRYEKAYLLGKSDSDFVMVERNLRSKDNEDEIILNCYSHNLEKKWSVNDPGKGSNFSHRNIFYSEGRVFFISERKNDYNQHYEFKIEHLVSPSGVHSDSVIMLFKVREWEENKKLRTPVYSCDYQKSTSGKNLLFTYSNNYTEKYKEGLQYRIMDSNSVLSEIRQLELPYPDPLCNIESVLYDDKNGQHVYLLTSIYDDPSVKKRNIIRYEIFKVNLNDHSYSLKILPLDGVVKDVKFLFKDDYIYAGYLHSVHKYKFTSSIQVLKIDSLLDVQETFIQPYQFNYKDSVYFSKHENFNPYSLVNMEILPNGDIVAVGEQNNFQEKGFQMIMVVALGPPFIIVPIPMSGSTKPVEFESSSMMVSYLGKNKTGYSMKIPKYQRDKNLQHVSHLLLPSNDCAYLIYTRDSLKTNGKTADLAAFRVHESGCIEDSSLSLPVDALNPRPKTGSYINLDNRNYIIAAADNRKHYLMKLNIKNDN